MNGISKAHFPGTALLARAQATFRNFFSEQDSPFNLAVFRIVLFLWVIYSFDREQVLWFSRMPPEMMFPPVGTQALLSFVPVNPQWASVASSLFMIFCFLAMAGCFTRTSSLFAALLGIYVRGIPQFFGKVNHGHHLIWFMLILAASRCADVLSVDAVGLAFRRADRGEPSKIEKSVEYALPLRFIMLLMGVIYFFPGFWKLTGTPGRWIWSDNLKHQLYSKWFELGGWVPAFRIDHYPLLYKLSALATIGFELTFFVLILFPALRSIALVAGLLFHNMTWFFMRISFIGLQICYVALVDWSRVFARIGQWLFREPLFVLYDGNCKICRRTIATLRAFDIFDRIHYLNALDTGAVAAAGVDWIDRADLMRDMHAVTGKRKWVGFESYRKMALRIPLLWPIWPLLWVPPVPWAGRAVYRRVANSRTCQVPGSAAQILHHSARPQLGWLKIVGCGLLIGSILFGSLKLISAWPLACYPTFAKVIREAKKDTIISYGIVGGEEKLLELDPVQEHMPPERFSGLIRSILNIKDPVLREKKLKALLHLMAAQGINLSSYSAVRFYRATYSTRPERAQDPFVSRVLETEISL